MITSQRFKHDNQFQYKTENGDNLQIDVSQGRSSHSLKAAQQIRGIIYAANL